MQYLRDKEIASLPNLENVSTYVAIFTGTYVPTVIAAVRKLTKHVPGRQHGAVVNTQPPGFQP